MMESCLAGKPERVGPVEVDDIRRDLLGEFTSLPALDSSQSQSENLQVYLRVRPFTAAESSTAGSQECVTIEGPDTVVLKPPRSCQSNRQSDKSLPQTAQRFTFTQVFGPEAGQRTVFDGSVRGLVRDVLNGGNCLVFTYGVTNAGKTFTFLGPDHDGGLLPRSLSLLFSSVGSCLYSRCDLKPQRCRDISRLTPEQQAAESSSKRSLLRLCKESDKSQTSGRSTFLEGSSLSDSSVSEADSFCLDVPSNVRFSIWVSFCEIYNDNIHDLLEQVPGGHQRRTVLRLSQDVKGNSFIKDLRWVQVSSPDEAYRVMKIGKRNQSFSSTKLNHLSSRSHSIFSIRILKVDDVGVPRVLGISELSLCDLAGSERCSRTQNSGERLKEAGNINSSLLTLGKCINAMKLNQNNKFQHHVPFRESKLTHFLQFFFCGAGRVTMVVNINQNSACFDETLNVLKFSALAQKVVVLNSRPVVLDVAPVRSAMELSMIIDEAEQRRKVTGRGRKSSLVAWETTLEDVLEDEDEEKEEEEEEEESVMEGTVMEAGGEEEEEEDRTMEEEQEKAALRLVLEAQIREEVSAEFMELFSKMEKDYSDRLEKEKAILEERAEKRVEILKTLVSRTVDLPAADTDSKEAMMEGMISSLTEDLEKIRQDAQSVHQCLSQHTHTAELESLRLEKQESDERLQEAQQRLSELMQMCQQKDDVINKLQEKVDVTMETATKDRTVVESIRSELLQLQKTCRCLRRTGGGDQQEEQEEQHQEVQEQQQKKKRQHEDSKDEEEGGPAKKRAVLEEEIWRLQEENEKKEETIVELRESEERRRNALEEELRRRKQEVEELEQKVLKLTGLDQCLNCDSVFSSLESERRETSRLNKENKALVNGIFQLQTQVGGLQTQLREQSDRCDSLSEELGGAKSRLLELQSQSEDRTQGDQEAGGRSLSGCDGGGGFHGAMEQLKQESRAALERAAQTTRRVQELEENLAQSRSTCDDLTRQLANQEAEFSRRLESEGAALRGREEEQRAGTEEKEKLLEESCRQVEALRTELERLKQQLQRKEEEEEEEEEEKENRVEQEERKVPVVEELKEEIQRLQERRGRRQQQQEEEEQEEERRRGRRSRGKYEAVKKEVERVRRLKEAQVSPLLTSSRSNRRRNPRSSGRKRKSCEVQELQFSENKRHRQTPCEVKQTDRSLPTIRGLIHGSPSLLGSTAKTIVGLVTGHSGTRGAVTTATKSRRGRRKLYKTDAASPLLVSPHAVSAGAAEEKESDHLIIRRQLRSKTSRK